jgi:hypothetical protein
MGATVTTIMGIFGAVAPYIPYLITGAAAAAAALPQAKPNTAWAGFRSVIDFAAMNFGNARNITPLQAKVVEEIMPPK